MDKITIQDDGVSALEDVKIIVEETKQVEKFSGSIADLDSEVADLRAERTRLLVRIDEIDAELASTADLKVSVQAELEKLPARP